MTEKEFYAWCGINGIRLEEEGIAVSHGGGGHTVPEGGYLLERLGRGRWEIWAGTEAEPEPLGQKGERAAFRFLAGAIIGNHQGERRISTIEELYAWAAEHGLERLPLRASIHPMLPYRRISQAGDTLDLRF